MDNTIVKIMKDFALNEAFKKLRNILEKSQSQFAALIGVSLHTVVSIENNRNGVSQKMTGRIFAATGAVLGLKKQRNLRLYPNTEDSLQ